MSPVKAARLTRVRTVDTRIALDIVSVSTLYCRAMTNGIAPQGPAASMISGLDQSVGAAATDNNPNTRIGWSRILAITTVDSNAFTSRNFTLESTMPSANSEIGGAELLAKLDRQSPRVFYPRSVQWVEWSPRGFGIYMTSAAGVMNDLGGIPPLFKTATNGLFIDMGGLGWADV